MIANIYILGEGFHEKINATNACHLYVGRQ